MLTMRATILYSLTLAATAALQAAHADDLAGWYAGGSIGQSRLEATGQTILTPLYHYDDSGSFTANHSAYKLTLGLRPISLFGAELSYVDFGHAAGGFNALAGADVRMRAAAAWGVLYLPVPLVDVFLKAGLARVQSTVNGTGLVGPNCGAGVCTADVAVGLFSLERNNTRGAGGIGVQYRVGPLAARAEYERYSAAGGNPSMLSVGATWSF